jgi:small-conductance mechanosensitive channel
MWHEGMKKLIQVANLASRLVWLTLLLVGLALAALPAVAQQSGTQQAAPIATSGTTDTPPPQVQDLLRLLADPAVRDWVNSRAPIAAPAPAAPPEMTPGGYMSNLVAAIRGHLAVLITTVPNLPQELNQAWTILRFEFQESGVPHILVLIAGFLALGFLLEWLFRRATGGVQKWVVEIPLDSVTERLRAAGIRLLFGLGIVLSFAIGSVGTFLPFDWPPLLREIVLGYLLAFLIVRFTLVISRFLLAPGGERFRLVLVSTEAAWFWYRRIGYFTGWLTTGWVTVGILATLGLSQPARLLVAYTLGLGLLALAIEITWRHPESQPVVAEPGPIESAENGQRRRQVTRWLWTGYFILLWLLWVAGAMEAFWLLTVVAGLPLVIGITNRAVNHLLRPPGAAIAAAGVPSVLEVCLARGARTLMIVAAAAFLAHVWHLDLAVMTMKDTLPTRLLRGVLSAIVIALVAEFIWHFMRALIDSKLASTKIINHADSEEERRRARLQTLLPILRNIAFIGILMIAIMMILSAMGIEIGPLVAGAGVVGVAVGFGAQTLVKDVISGIFYLLDDAFRIGEYIQSGSYKGTVESFSLRSVKLRHHRGPLYTVPFGVLGAIQNMSRDWVIDKLTIGVSYDTDLDQVRKLIKSIGQQLLADPDCAPYILEPLKMQGVEAFGDYAIQIRMKMMTKPGEQFVIRRKALALIKKSFHDNGINFAFPTVQVAGGSENAAVAHQLLELNAAKAAQTE